MVLSCVTLELRLYKPHSPNSPVLWLPVGKLWPMGVTRRSLRAGSGEMELPFSLPVPVHFTQTVAVFKPHGTLSPPRAHPSAAPGPQPLHWDLSTSSFFAFFQSWEWQLRLQLLFQSYLTVWFLLFHFLVHLQLLKSCFEIHNVVLLSLMRTWMVHMHL